MGMQHQATNDAVLIALFAAFADWLGHFFEFSKKMFRFWIWWFNRISAQAQAKWCACVNNSSSLGSWLIFLNLFWSKRVTFLNWIQTGCPDRPASVLCAVFFAFLQHSLQKGKEDCAQHSFSASCAALRCDIPTRMQRKFYLIHYDIIAIFNVSGASVLPLAPIRFLGALYCTPLDSALLHFQWGFGKFRCSVDHSYHLRCDWPKMNKRCQNLKITSKS